MIESFYIVACDVLAVEIPPWCGTRKCKVSNTNRAAFKKVVPKIALTLFK
jgi:hypothetical protein